MIGKTIATFDNLLPVEDTDHLRRLLFEVEHPQDPQTVDLSAEREAIERLQAMLGSRFTISGGEVVEFGSAEWYDQIKEIPF